MEKVIAAIQDWPVLMQAAIGSGLFWLLLVVGQWLTTSLSTQFSNLSKQRRKSVLLTEIIKLRALKTSLDEVLGGSYASILWYRASRRVVMGLIWLTLGLIFGSIVDVLGIVGFIGCLYYLFSALNVVGTVSFEGDIDEKIKEMEKKLEGMN